MISINNVQTAAQYTPALTLGPTASTEKIVYLIANAACIVQFANHSPDGVEQEWGPEIVLTPSSGEINRVQGMRFKSIPGGNPASIVAQLIQPGDVLPSGGQAFLGTLTGSGSVIVAGSPPTLTIFNAAGAFAYSPPVGCVAILVECIGGGGAGGGAPATGAGQAGPGGGGGGGGYAAALIASPSNNAPYAVTVGAGGVGVNGANGNPGGATDFGGLVTAAGGAAGLVSAAAAPPLAIRGGVGGAGTVGSVRILGGAGEEGFGGGAASGCYGGGGGSGARGATGGLVTVSTGSNGNSGSAPGGGGAGATNGQNAAAKTGGAGGDGVVIITEFY